MTGSVSHAVSTNHLSRDVRSSYYQTRADLVNLNRAAEGLAVSAFASAQGAREIKASLISMHKSGCQRIGDGSGTFAVPIDVIIDCAKEVKDEFKRIGRNAQGIAREAEFMTQHQDKLMKKGSWSMCFVPYEHKARFTAKERDKIANRLSSLVEGVDRDQLKSDVVILNGVRSRGQREVSDLNANLINASASVLTINARR
ncbi:MAG TPA: hypothetical protein VFX23_02700 [Limnobacter sp.]|uniref:hypothetical protein n=1 Tax=Limnobacter sp. TaxID=2003368 RepID=UPI002E366769|nr:hypothetical protein [Limnobacter sp.]HEX5484884.1 hypothetical protein [Limnobacter sp.]